MNLYQVSIEKMLGCPPQLGDPKPYIKRIFVVANSFREVCEAYPKAKKIKTIAEGLDIIGTPTAKDEESRCCGRCDGYNDICIADMVCEQHQSMGCEICYGPRRQSNAAPG